MPEWMQWQTAAVFRAGKQRFGHDRETAANASETTVLGKTAQFDCAFECTRNFENGMRNFRLRDIRLVSRVEEQQRFMFARILDPARQLLARCHRARRIIRKAKIDKIDMFRRRLRNEIVFGGARQIHDPFVTAVFSRGASVARHHVCIDIDWINGIGDCDFVLVAEDIEDVTAIAFRSVGQKDFVVRDVDLAIAIIVLRDCRS